MTRAIAVRAHSRTLPDKHPPVFYQKCAELREEVARKDAAVLDHMTILLRKCVEEDVAEFGEAP